jgi:GMP synthase-like glutamine amidotransferase
VKILCLQHVPFEGPASIETWARRRGHEFATVALYADDPLPSVSHIDWLVVMGGPMSVHEEERHPWLAGEKHFIEAAIHDRKIVLGVCLGAQLVASVLGARVHANAEKEIGWFPVARTEHAARTRVGRVLPVESVAFHWHGDTFELPQGAVHVARSEGCENQAFVYQERVVGLQFHLETTPASARALIEHCGAEIVPGRYIQSSETMTADARRFSEANAVMERVLAALAAMEAAAA